MADQADKLRQLIHRVEPCAREASDGPAMVVVAGGKSGVGATTVAVNVAAVLAARVERLLVVDAVENQSNLMAAAGVRRSGDFGLADVLGGKCEIGDAIVDGPAGTMVLASRRVSPRIESASQRNATTWGRHEQQRLMSALDSLRDQIDLIVVDAGSGVSAWSRRFWLRAQLVVLVTTTDGPATLDAYAMLKRSVADASGPDIRLLLNQCDHERRGAEAQQRFGNACERFLGRGVPALPSLPRCEHEVASGRSWPRVWEGADTEFGRAMLWVGRAVADAIEGNDLSAAAGGERTRIAS